MRSRESFLRGVSWALLMLLLERFDVTGVLV